MAAAADAATVTAAAEDAATAAAEDAAAAGECGEPARNLPSTVKHPSQ